MVRFNRGMFVNMFTLGILPIAMASCSDGESSTPAFAPTTSAQSYEISMDPIEVPPGSELYKCQDFVNPFGKDVAIIASKSVMSPGSHHFAAFRMEILETAAIWTARRVGSKPTSSSTHRKRRSK